MTKTLMWCVTWLFNETGLASETTLSSQVSNGRDFLTTKNLWWYAWPW